MAKYIFVTGGVVSSLGKGISASALGHLLKSRGLKVFMQKFDPYINVDPGTMSPYQHGEVFVTKDGGETDLDLGHYERFIDVSLTKNANITAGKVYQSVIEKERKGEYLGRTVQVIPHITNEIKSKVYAAAKESGADIVITEIGGTVGDIESLPFIEAVRQVRRDVGVHNTCFIHNTLVPYLKAAGEIKTKPTQHSVKELRALGIHPDVIILRTEVPIDEEIKEKIALFCDVKQEAVIEAQDVEILYEIVIKMQEQGFDDVVCEHLQLSTGKPKLEDWKQLIHTIRHLKDTITIGLVGKYVQLHDAYLSVNEALKHAGYFHETKVNIKWIDAELVDHTNVESYLNDVDGLLVPGGFGDRAIEGKIAAITYARENNLPFFGICLGMQLATIEFARNVVGLKGAHSSEMDEETPYPIIDYLPEQYKGIDFGGTLRLGEYDCAVAENTKAFEAYQRTLIKERHRHRYEFNNEYKKRLEEVGLLFSGINPQTGLAEIIELVDHPWFVACQFHPEFMSRPTRPQPLFREFVKASLSFHKNN
jgi:CTP synthase